MFVCLNSCTETYLVFVPSPYNLIHNPIVFEFIIILKNVYTNGEYLKRRQTWHAEDSLWKAEHIYKIYHIPLDLSVSSVLNDSFIKDRRNLGHVQYFSFQSAIACLQDTGHVILDYFFKDVGMYYYEQSLTLKRTIANLPRRILAFFNIALAAKIFGRYSIMILTQ